VASAISGLVVVFLVVSAGLALITQDARAAIARGGLIFLAIAIAAAVSVATRSPLSLARPDEAYRRPPVLRAMRVVTRGRHLQRLRPARHDEGPAP
jgi:hypothetical protein